MFFDNFLPICVSALTDNVFAIREENCKLMLNLYLILKGEDFEKKLLDKLNEMCSSTSYLVRNTVLFLIKEFCQDEQASDFVEKKLSQIVFRLIKDKVGNIRMNAAVTLKVMMKTVKTKEILREVNTSLEVLSKDRDNDVLIAVSES